MSAEGTEYVAHVLVMPVLLAIGFVGQSLNLLTLSQPCLRGVTFIYLKAIAVADLLSILALVPFVLRHAKLHASGNYIVMLYHCHLEIPLINALLGAATLCIVGLTLERYLSVCHPIVSHTWSRRRELTQSFVVFMYALAFIIFVPSVFQKELVEITTSWVDNCSTIEYRIRRNDYVQSFGAFKAYLIVREIVVRLGPIALLIMLNVRISFAFRDLAHKHRLLQCRAYRSVDTEINLQVESPLLANAGAIERSSVPRGQSPCPPRQGSNDVYDNERRVYVLLVITVVTFVVCTLPASVLSLIVGENAQLPHLETNTWYQVFRAGANLLEATSCFGNFYIYALCCRDYRTAFWNVVTLHGERNRLSHANAALLAKTTPAAARQRAARPPPPPAQASSLLQLPQGAQPVDTSATRSMSGLRRRRSSSCFGAL